MTMLKKRQAVSNAHNSVTAQNTKNGEILGESEELYRNMIELSPDAIVVADLKGTILLCNSAATKMSGYSKDEMVGKHFSRIGIVRFIDAPKYLKIFTSTRGQKIPKPLELRFYRKDKTTIWTEILVGWLKIGSKMIAQATIRDITEHKQMEQEIQEKNNQLEARNEELRATEEELRHTNEELQTANKELKEAHEQLVRSEKLAAIGQLAGGVGHELRNPLGAINNAAYYIKGKLLRSGLARKEPRVMEFLNIMDEEIATSNKIINDLLNFARTGKPAVSLASLEAVIDSTLPHLNIPENITVTKKLDADLPQVEIDVDQMRQVIVNLITNAAQAMPEGGELTISAHQTKRSLEISITDTGSGIPKELIGKIFDPLFTTKAKGIGLGLAVCKSIIDNHKGSISVSSRVNKGTTFTIKLPLDITSTQGG
jgi:PAS domain S-box-containing protein